MEEDRVVPPRRAAATVVERKLQRFHSLDLDPAEVRASRDFHFEHWLRIAQAAIQNDHRESYYGALSPLVEDTLADAAEPVPEELQRAVLKDLAFIEGHLQAFRAVLSAVEELRAKRQ